MVPSFLDEIKDLFKSIQTGKVPGPDGYDIGFPKTH